MSALQGITHYNSNAGDYSIYSINRTPYQSVYNLPLAVSLLWSRSRLQQPWAKHCSFHYPFFPCSYPSPLLSCRVLSCLVPISSLVSSLVLPCLCLVLSLVPCRVMFIFLVFLRWLGDGAGQDSVGGGIRAVLPKKTTYPEQRDQHDHLINITI